MSGRPNAPLLEVPHDDPCGAHGIRPCARSAVVTFRQDGPAAIATTPVLRTRFDEAAVDVPHALRHGARIPRAFPDPAQWHD
jgi:hypothetical protein